LFYSVESKLVLISKYNKTIDQVFRGKQLLIIITDCPMYRLFDTNPFLCYRHEKTFMIIFLEDASLTRYTNGLLQAKVALLVATEGEK
jgi:hypothetical protein